MAARLLLTGGLLLVLTLVLRSCSGAPLGELLLEEDGLVLVEVDPELHEPHYRLAREGDVDEEVMEEENDDDEEEEEDDEEEKEDQEDDKSEEEDDEDKSEEDDDDKSEEKSEEDDEPSPSVEVLGPERPPAPLQVPVLPGDDDVALAGSVGVLTPEEAEVATIAQNPLSTPPVLRRMILDDDGEEEENQDDDSDADRSRFLFIGPNSSYGWHGSWSRPYSKYNYHNRNVHDKHAITYHHGFYTGLY